MPPKRQFHLEGYKFGELTVLEETDPYICITTGGKERKWKCLCSCGKIIDVRQASLRRGKTKSCGHLRKK